MSDADKTFQLPPHDHVFLGRDHEQAERRTWGVIILCSIMMIAEIVGGALFGSLALIADGLHMSTHAGALLLAALAYSFARKYANDRTFSFGTGKFGDLAGYSSAIVLAMIALLIGYEAVSRLLHPIPISFSEAIPIAVLGLAVNVVSAWLLSGGHHHGHHHSHNGGGPPRAGDPRILRIGAVREGSRRTTQYRDRRNARRIAASARKEHKANGIRRARSPAWPRRASPRQQYAGRGGSRDGRCRRIRSGHCRPFAGARVRLALDGPAGRPDRRHGHCQLVGRVAARHRRHPARPHAGSRGWPSGSAS